MLLGGSMCDGAEGGPHTVFSGSKSSSSLRPVSAFTVICAVAAVARWWHSLGGGQTTWQLESWLVCRPLPASWQ